MCDFPTRFGDMLEKYRAYRASLGAFGPSIVPQPEILDPPLGAPTL